ncbi:MAG: hypothetical protein R3B99_35555 [Polyangiales bacterium]
MFEGRSPSASREDRQRLFAETRLRRGVYGQRYDNGLRDDGTGPKALTFPSGDLTKGPETVWDAPGAWRIKVPCGLSSESAPRGCSPNR